MSRQNKAAKKRIIAEACSKARQAGNPGPSSTVAKHGKRYTYRTNPEIQKRLAELKGGIAPTQRKGSRRELVDVGAAAE